jgi:hypothetical protein
VPDCSMLLLNIQEVSVQQDWKVWERAVSRISTVTANRLILSRQGAPTRTYKNMLNGICAQ